MIGFWKRLSFAFRAFFRILFSGRLPDDVAAVLGRPVEGPDVGPAPVLGTPPAEGPDRAVQLLALLQRDGRLVDFLMEDVAAYSDAQVGAAVRAVHTGCRQVLERYLQLEAVLGGSEDDPITLEGAVDPASVKLVGRVTGRAPFRGVLRHRGWRLHQANLPPLPDGAGRGVVAPAEVEIA